MRLLLLPELTNFFGWAIQNQIKLTYKGDSLTLPEILEQAKQTDTNTKRAIFLAYQGFTQTTWTELYKLFCSIFLRQREANNEFALKGPNGFLIQTHHIQPLSAGGDNSSSNRVNCNIYLHGIAHFIRFFSSQHNSDINGVNNSLRTVDEITLANEKRIDARRRVQSTPGTPFKKGVTPPKRSEITLAQKARMSERGRRSQDQNSAGRVDPLTRFICSLVQVWSRVDQPNSGLKVDLGLDVKDHKVANVCDSLVKQGALSIDRNKYHLLSEPIKGENRRFNLEILTVTLPSSPRSVYTVTEAKARFKFLLNKDNNRTTREEFLKEFPNDQPFYTYYYKYKAKVKQTYPKLS
jgi:hypothetical protein